VPPASDEIPLTPDRVFEVIAPLCPDDVILVEESPSNVADLQRRFKTAKPDTFYTFASGGLGWDAPAPFAPYTATSPNANTAGANISPPAAQATAQAFGQLADRILMPADGRTLEDVVRELLRPLLKEWLDRNLPISVQEKVNEEVERLARRLKEWTGDRWDVRAAAQPSAGWRNSPFSPANTTMPMLSRYQSDSSRKNWQ